ncbi:MAG: hydrogenase small subunit [Deltaproteobacteria bacterium]|nr:hydrogenase small subunit [Deltaproteobacteria bacterium]
MPGIVEVPAVWIQGGSCSGCSVSVLNSLAPSIANVLIDDVVPGKHINLRFHATIMAGAGQPVIQVLEDTRERSRGEYLLVVEGAIPTADGGVYCRMGERDGEHVTFHRWAVDLGRDALAVIALGTCACFGGIPGGAPNPTGVKPLMDIYREAGVATPLINVPGCAPHPDWFVGTLAGVLLGGLPKADELDDLLRPKAFFGNLVHEHCPRRAYFDEGKFAAHFGEPGCLYELGCKGPITYADCPDRGWNSGVSWCIKAGMGCQACTQPEFPDLGSFYTKLADVDVPRIGDCWRREG